MSKRVRFTLWGIIFSLGALGIVPWARALDGAALYGQYCAGCHGPLATSSKLGRSASQIQDAINSIPMMSSLKSLTTAQINAIADALSPAPPPPPPPPPPPSGDTTPPSVTAFSIPPTSDSLTVPIQALAATDNVGVTGYKITESSTPPKASAAGWSGSALSSYTFSSGGTKILYAWAKDAAGNVSASANASVVIALSNPPPPPPPPPPSEVDFSSWVGQWLKMTIRYEGYAFGTSSESENGEASGSEKPPEMAKDHQQIAVYLKITGWDPQQNVLQAEIYQYDEKSNQWSSDPLTLHFAGGTATDFLCWSQEEGGFTFGFAARVQGRARQGTLQSGSLKTLGGYYLELSAGSSGSVGAPGSSGQMAGGLSLSGSLVPESKVPVPK